MWPAAAPVLRCSCRRLCTGRLPPSGASYVIVSSVQPLVTRSSSRRPLMLPLRTAASVTMSPQQTPATSSSSWLSLKHAALAVGGVAIAATAISFQLEPEPDETSIPRKYDPDAFEAYFRARPLAVCRRYLEIAKVLGPLVVGVIWDWKRGNLDDDAACYDKAVKTREALVQLGPAFIKLGQALSIRPDLIPAVALKELQRLCDDCPSFPWHTARATIEAELGRSVADIFDGLGAHPEPIAAASIGQVYRWRLRSRDCEVAVKVQRPDMVHAVALDLFILRQLAHVVRYAVRCITRNRTDHVALLDAFAYGTVGELDYEAEAENQQRFRDELGRRFPDTVYVPQVYSDTTSRRVLVTEWIDGPRLADCTPAVVKSLCPIGIECFLSQLLEIGLFHSDPHPGNLLVSEGRLVLLDFGLVAHIDKADLNLHRHATAIVHLINSEYNALLDDFIALGFLPADINKEQILPPIRSVLEQGMAAGADIKRRKKNFQGISDDLNDIFFEMPFSVPEYFALVTRALATLEGIALLGDPEFDIFWAAYPYALSSAKAVLGSRQTTGLLTVAAARAAQQMSTSERARFWSSKGKPLSQKPSSVVAPLDSVGPVAVAVVGA